MKRVLSAIAALLLVALVSGACTDPQRDETGSSKSRDEETRPKDSVLGAPTVVRPTMGIQAREQERSVLDSPAAASSVTGAQATEQGRSVLGRSATPTPAMSVQAAKPVSPALERPTSPAADTATPQQGSRLQERVKPEGYYHGVEHGLAVTQTARAPSNVREGWVDITLNLAVVRFDGAGLSVKKSVEAGSVCFDGETATNDCFQVKWGSEEQFEADLSDERSIAVERGGFGVPAGKAVNMGVTFEVAANATNASLLFGEHRVPLDLNGDYVLKEGYADPVSAPSAPPSQDEKTAGYFMGSGHGIAVTKVSRAGDGDSLMVVGRVELSVLWVGDYGAPAGEGSSYENSGSVCLGETGTGCIGIFWGPEGQFNALTSSENIGALVEARREGSRWPLPVTVEFMLPAKYDTATLKFGDHSVAIDLRGMKGDVPTFDYRAHYAPLAATPGSVLYESGGKTIVLDGIRQNSQTGDIEIAMTARNDSEASDFSPKVLLSGDLFAQNGRIGWVSPARTNEGKTPTSSPSDEVKTLAPGQRESLHYVVPRHSGEKGNSDGYSSDPEKRTDGVVLRMMVGDGLDDTDPVALPPGFISFDRVEDERKFWPGLKLWRYEGSGDRYFSAMVTDGARLYASQRASEEGNLVHALDTNTGELVWRHGMADLHYTLPIPVALADGVVYTMERRPKEIELQALKATDGEVAWRFKLNSDFPEYSTLTVTDGVVYVGSRDQGTAYVYAVDGATGKLAWRYPVSEDIVRYVTVADGTLYLREGHNFHIVDVATRELVRTLEGNIDKATVAGGVVYAVVKEGGVFGDPTYYVDAVDAAAGTRLWRFKVGRYGVPVVAVADGVTYVIEQTGPLADSESRLFALDAATGNFIPEFGRRSVKSWLFTVEDGVFYLGSEGGLQVLDATTGEQLWTWEIGTQGGWISTMKVADRVLYLGVSPGLDESTGDYIQALVAAVPVDSHDEETEDR